MTRSLLEMAARLNAVRIDVEDLLNATAAVHKLPPEDRDWEGHLHLMARLFKGNPDKGLAVAYRIQAMGRSLESGKLPGWTMPKQPYGSVLIAEPVWKAAAHEPLLLRNRSAHFDEHGFLDRILSYAEPEGDA
jgi:hypothetical protein